MATFHQVRAMPRATRRDPQGQAVEHALGALGFRGATGERVGRARSAASGAGMRTWTRRTWSGGRAGSPTGTAFGRAPLRASVRS